VTRSCRKQRPVHRPELRPLDLTTQNLELVPQHHQLDILYTQPTPAPNERAEQSSNGDIEEREDHATDPSSPTGGKTRHQ
jgi:hypothetical protein